MNKLSTRIKLFYGFGFASIGIKDGLFQLFLFFYFSQILGLDAALAGTASIIALIFDAVSDPIIGMLSDRWKSVRWGRRHPFMLAAAIPFGLFIYLLFLPPEGLNQMGLFGWLTGFSVLVRLSLTLFIVPGMSLGAELTTDYDERTSVTSYRVMFGAFVAPIIMIIGLVLFFTPTAENSNGMFNVAAYPKFAALCGFLISLIILISTIGTKSIIPYLPQRSEEARATPREIFRNFTKAFRMKSYRSVILFTMMTFVAIGIGTVFVPYYVTYYFGMTEKELALLPIASGIGGLISLFIAPYMGKKFDKRKTAIISNTFLALFFSAPYILRILDFMPANGSTSLLGIFIALNTIGYAFMFVNLSITPSMMADVVDEYETISGDREEGLFFSTMSFAYKCTFGFGFFIAGFLLKLIAFPAQTDISDVPSTAIDGLGYVGGPLTFLIYISAIFFILPYPISKKRYEEIRTTLAAT